MISGDVLICYRMGVAGKVVSFMLMLFVFGAFSFFSYNSAYAACSSSISVDGSVELNITQNNGGVTTDIVKVNTDCLNGYTLSASGPTDSSLYLNGDSSSDNHIGPTLGTKDSPSMIVGEGKFGTWGISIDSNTTTSSNTFFNIPNKGIELFSKNSPSETGGDNITIYYGASAPSDLKAGAYTMASGSEITYYLVAHAGVTVFFDANGGTTPSFTSKEVTAGQAYGELPTTSRDGYTFLGWSLLPSEYQEVEYIESTGTQYIDTGFIPNQDTRIVADFQYTVTNAKRFTGAEHLQPENREFRFGTADQDGRPWLIGYGSSGLRAVGSSDMNRHVLDFNKNTVYLDSQILYTFEYESFNAYGNAYIFSVNSNAINDLASAKLYSYKLYDNGILVRDYIPCYRKSDNVVGLYDAISGEFYANRGSGSFINGEDSLRGHIVDPNTIVSSNDSHTLYAVWAAARTVTFNANGGIVDPITKTVVYGLEYGELPIPTKDGYAFIGWSKYNIPDGYQAVEYIQSTGSQYIDTGFTPNQDTRMIADFQYTKNNQGYRFTGSEHLNPNNQSFRFGSSQGRYWMVGYGNGGLVNVGTSNTDRHLLDFNKNIVYLDGRVLHTFNYSIFNSFGNAYIFSINSNSTADLTPAKLYSYRLYDNDNIIRNYIPCYKTEGTLIGLFDTENGTFYTNQGSGYFSKGDDINTYVDSQTRVAKDEDHILYAIWREN